MAPSAEKPAKPVSDDSEKAIDSDKKSKKEKKEKKDKDSKKEKKEKKREKLADDGVKKSKSKDKKDADKKTAKLASAVARELDSTQTESRRASRKADRDEDGDVDVADASGLATSVQDVLAPFAFPLADDTLTEDVFEIIKLGAKLNMVSRGVKECKKAIKKAPLKADYAKGEDNKKILVIIGGDVSPMEVTMSLPMMCEERNIVYLFVKSRVDLGQSSGTKRSTAIVVLHTTAKKTPAGVTEDEQKKMLKKYLAKFPTIMGLAQEEYKKQVLNWVQGIHPAQINFDPKTKTTKADKKAESEVVTGTKNKKFGYPFPTD